MFSFINGMQTFPKAIAEKLGERVIKSADVTSVVKEDTGYKVTYTNSGSTNYKNCDILISTVPAYTAKDLFCSMDDNLAKHFEQIYYPPVVALFLVYKKSVIGQPLDGFGFLIPSKERKSFLGAIWSSVLFPNRAKDDEAAFTLFIGGARNPEIGNIEKEILFKKVRSEFESLMNISGEPVFLTYRYWSKSIPQYNVGYIEHERYFDEFEKKNPGVILGGNYRGGISVGDCIKNSEILVKKIKSLW